MTIWPMARPLRVEYPGACQRLRELVERLGQITVSGLENARQTMARRLRKSRILRDRVEAIEARISDPISKSDD